MHGSSLRIIREEHWALAAMLKSSRMMVERGPREDRQAFFEVLRAMLLYVDEFPERLHHPKETDLLFPRVVQVAPETALTVARLDQDHVFTEQAVHQLMRLLVAWEMIGDTRREAFMATFYRYVDLYLEHMRMEETEILPVAKKHFTPEDWAELDAAFEANRDSISGQKAPEQEYEALFARIVQMAPAPIGLR